MHLKYGSMLGVRKPRRNDMDGSNPDGNQITYFVGWVENLNVTNFACNYKKSNITFETKLTICV